MKVIFKHYQPEENGAIKKRCNELIGSKTSKIRLKVDELEGFIKKVEFLTGNYISDPNDYDGADRIKQEVRHAMYQYATCILNKLKDPNFDPLDERLNRKRFVRIEHMNQYFSTVSKVTHLPTLSVNRKVLYFKGKKLDNKFIQDATTFYISSIDPFGLWFTPQQLHQSLKGNEQTDLKYALLLYMMRFCDGYNKELKGYAQYYYNYLNLRLSELYSKPNLDNILALILLASYEASHYRLIQFKKLLFMAVRMGQMLGYDKLSEDPDLNKIENLNCIKRLHLIREVKIWHMIVLTCSALSSILGESVIECVPKIPTFTKLTEEYNESAFILAFSEPNSISKLPIVNEAKKNFSLLLSAFNLINDYHTEWRMGFDNNTFKDILDYYAKLPYKECKEVDILIHKLRERLGYGHSARRILMQDFTLINWLGAQHFSMNWLSFAPIYMIIMYNLLILFPLSMRISGIAAIDLLRASNIIEPCFRLYFDQWYDSITKDPIE